ncbi:MAG: pyridoxal-phosphate dependent enzyme [Kofleriaceae bacterium]|nr:pyridoxal-phosphate dependent enzyme [Kofleriaceae bacterium]
MNLYNSKSLGVAALVCSGCDAQIPADELLRFSCPNRGIGDDDHVLRVQLSPDEIRDGWPGDSPADGANPFIRYRKLSYGYLQAMRLGMADSEYVAVVRELADAIAQFDKPMQCTELSYCDALGCWIKNETENISGSHKARHLIGTAIDMEVATRLGGGSDAPLAIASCGNAALAAAVVAKAAGRQLQVFVPSNANPAVVARLESLGATRIVCEMRSSKNLVTKMASCPF